MMQDQESLTLRWRTSLGGGSDIIGWILPIEAADTMIIGWWDCIALWLSKMEDQKLFMLFGYSFLGDSSNVVATMFGLEGGQYFDYVSQQPSLFLIIRLTRPRIVDASMTLVSRMGQRVCHYHFYL